MALLAFLLGGSLLAPPVLRAQAAGASAATAPVPQPIEGQETGAVQWLVRQMVPNAEVPAPEPGRRRLLLSYRVPPTDPAYRCIYGRSAIYDDALGAIALTMVGRYREAEFLLGAVSRLVRADGGLWFAYNIQNDWPSESDHEGAMLRTGAVAWSGYALVYYLQARSLDAKDPLGIQFRAAAQSIARWLLDRQVPAGVDPRAELLTGGSGSTVLAFPEGAAGPVEVSSAAAVQWVSTEHNIDAWYFLRDLGRLTGNARYAQAAERIRVRVLELWNPRPGCRWTFPYQFSDYPSVASTAWFVIAAQMLRGTPAAALFWGK
jgi:hypothetical protein